MVSVAFARRMAEGALAHSSAAAAVGITGFAGPAGPEDEEGLVHLAVAARSRPTRHRECHFGAIGRDATRARTAALALEMLAEALSD